MGDMTEFPRRAIVTMQRMIEEKRESEELKDTLLNPILREDVFPLLSSYCTVIYYPLEQEENDGFHISMPVNGELKEFVYINTAKKTEKQVYAAAHELGHIWKVDDALRAEGLNIPCDHEKEDVAMNRFAAELLMPEAQFLISAMKKMDELSESRSSQGTRRIISEGNLFRAVAYLMDEFFVPFEAVVRRLSEVGLLTGKVCTQIVEERYKREDGRGRDLLEACISEGGYTKLQAAPSNKKAMTGFPELLNRVDAEKLFPAEKIEMLRSLLHIPQVKSTGDTISLQKEKKTGM